MKSLQHYVRGSIIVHAGSPSPALFVIRRYGEAVLLDIGVLVLEFVFKTVVCNILHLLLLFSSFSYPTSIHF